MVVVPSSNRAVFLQVVSNTAVGIGTERPSVVSYAVLIGKQGKQSVVISCISSSLWSSIHEVMEGILFS